jgi:hypothetical protein
MIREAAARAGQLLPALRALLKAPQGVRVDAVKGALDYLPLQDWPPLVATALDVFNEDRFHKVARVILESGLHQAPEAFHPHLARIFFEMEPFLEDFGPSVWRGSGRRSLAFLREVLAKDNVPLRARAVEVLLETHDPEVIAYALEERQRLGDRFHWHYARNPYTGYDYFDVIDGEVCILYPPRAYHVYFPQGYVEPQHQSPPLHPTWVNAAPVPQPVAFGGVSEALCTHCGRRLQHLLTLDPLPDGLGVRGLPRLSLEVCTNGNCLGLGPGAELFYRHNDAGRPHGIGDEPVDQGWEIPFIASTTAHLGVTEARWLWQDSNSRWANLHRLGGLPSWVQEPGHPACPICGNLMPFLMQLDSGPLTQDGGYVHWCSGLLYAFWCDRCKTSAFFRHCC